MATGTKERIVQRSAELFRRQGFAATGVKQIVAEASAPFGSLYHFFPGGKEQLGEEVIRWSGGIYGQLLDAFYKPGENPVVATRNLFAAAAQTLRATDYADACPIATVALEVSTTNEPMRQACADVFEGWVDGATERLTEAGLPRKRSRELSFSLIGALEGAFVLSRALRSTEPLDVAGASMTAELREAVAAQRKRRRARG
jgi:AcrR family transcriptional regulator